MDIVKGVSTGAPRGTPELLSSESVWRRPGPVNSRADGVAVSPDGGWLLFQTGMANNRGGSQPEDCGLYVLDTATGNTAFHLPTEDADAQIKRLSSVLPKQPAENDIGQYMGAFFAGDGKLVVRRFKDTDNLIDWTSPIYDVYDLDSITVDAQPGYRFESNEHRANQCASLGFPGGLIEAEGGRLAYAPLR